MRRVQPDENRCTATVPSAKGRRCLKPKRFGNLCVKHAHADELHRERAARLAAEQERDRLQKLLAMMIHWAESAHERMRKLVPWESEVPGLSDLVDDVSGALGSIDNGYDFKSLRIYDHMKADRDAAVAALAVAREALEVASVYHAAHPPGNQPAGCTGCVIERARAALAKIDAAQRDSSVGATMSHCGKSPTDAAARGRKGER